MIDEQEAQLRKSALLMRILGWLLVVGLIPMVFIYPPGFMWGAAPQPGSWIVEIINYLFWRSVDVRF